MVLGDSWHLFSCQEVLHLMEAAAAASKATRVRYQHAPDLEEETKLLFCST